MKVRLPTANTRQKNGEPNKGLNLIKDVCISVCVYIYRYIHVSGSLTSKYCKRKENAKQKIIFILIAFPPSYSDSYRFYQGTSETSHYILFECEANCKIRHQVFDEHFINKTTHYSGARSIIKNPNLLFRYLYIGFSNCSFVWQVIEKVLQIETNKTNFMEISQK